MCEVSGMQLDGRMIRVADIKKKYIPNIIDAAGRCDMIDRVILFGSATGERCREDSDIDLAVFGNRPPSRALTSKKYERFARQLYAYDQNAQGYDILYFESGKENRNPIMRDIEQGEVLYARK